MRLYNVRLRLRRTLPHKNQGQHQRRICGKDGSEYQRHRLDCVLKNMIRKHPPAGIAFEEHPLSDCKIKVGASFLRGRYTKFANSLSETSPTATWPVHG